MFLNPLPPVNLIFYNQPLPQTRKQPLHLQKILARTKDCYAYKYLNDCL